MNKAQLLLNLYNSAQIRRDYIENTPEDMRDYIMGNAYATYLQVDFEMMIETIFGDAADIVYTFINEWKPGDIVQMDEQFIPVGSPEQYIQYLSDYKIIPM